MIQTICPNATFRDGQRGELGAPDANGFASFVSITGARFTVHVLECVRDALYRDGEYMGETLGRITGRECWTIRVDRVAAGPIMAVTRTPTAAQCNAKRSARRAEQIGERT
jgi:hypothetical protein